MDLCATGDTPFVGFVEKDVMMTVWKIFQHKENQMVHMIVLLIQNLFHVNVNI